MCYEYLCFIRQFKDLATPTRTHFYPRALSNLYFCKSSYKRQKKEKNNFTSHMITLEMRGNFFEKKYFLNKFMVLERLLTNILFLNVKRCYKNKQARVIYNSVKHFIA